ncbi:cytidine deaminase-like protein [Periconia macrospinosa]|uniref:Cytidine deaminase-like protein n=1 Tax=Periconia macrospinosa TaxID=97972 RepID=A0A2V1D8W2_9PLEO|nr:cytidine deaminase-like protein [Periconia macrospinosa]
MTVDTDAGTGTGTATGAISGRLVPLRTKDEVRASTETHQVYVVEIPSRFANGVKDLIHEAIPDLKTSEFSHLRRVVQHKFLPAQLQQQFGQPTKLPRGEGQHTSPILLSPPSTPLPPSPADTGSDLDGSPIYLSPSATPPASSPIDPEHIESPEAKTEDLVRYFLLCPTRYIQHADLYDLLRRNEPFTTYPTAPRILYVTVPTLSPTSQDQAIQWSETYWPIAYKNTNPYGPHPSLVARNTAEIAGNAAEYIALATSAGNQISQLGIGENIGCVVVGSKGGEPEVVAVAGDCRWRSPAGNAESHDGRGNAMAHSVQRAIAMVAKKRLRSSGANPTLLDRSLFGDVPLTDVERPYYEKDNVSGNGYLCVDLDIYLTHEPCVMCSMAILHSRFRRCVFANRMPLTGGMTADKIGTANHPGKGLQHGMFWRPSELNWKFLAWEWQSDDNEVQSSIDDTLHV